MLLIKGFFGLFAEKSVIKYSTPSVFNPILGVLQQNKLLHFSYERA